MRDKSTFIAWLSSFPEIYNSRAVFSALTELNEYYYSITKCKCNVLDLKEAEIQRLFDELRTDFFYARNHPQVHRKMLIILRLFREYQEYKKNAHYTCSHVRKMLSELHECCLGINRTKEAEERKKREFEILNTKPEVTIVYPKSYDRPFQPLPIKEVPSQGSSHTKGKKEKPGKYYRYFKNAKSLRTRSLSFQKDYHVVIDPLFSEIDNSDNSYDFSSWKWIYDEILRRAPALTPFVNEVRKLPRPKAGEIKLLIRQYQIGNLSALNNLLPYFYRICLKSALKVGREYNIEYVLKRKTAPISLSLKYRFYDKLVFQKLKRAIGMDNALFLPTAGAPIPPTIEEFIHSVGIGLVAGYGLTESLATVSCDHGVKTLGSVGRPLPGIEVKIGENDEILIKGPGVTCGYYKKESATREAFDKDGYFHTGDAGYLKDGELFITDRIKDLFKTSNGKYISPQVLEGRLCVDKYIEQLAVIAEQRKFVSALIIPAYDELKAYAAEHKIEYKDMKDLCQNKEINQMIKTRIDTLQQTFAAYEQIKRFTLLPEPFTIDKGELTNTLKIRRQVLLKNYSEEIDKMYEA